MDQAITRAAGAMPSTMTPAAAARRAWAILLTSANHGVVGPLGSTFPHAGEKHERVVVVEVPAGAGAPSDEVNLVLRAVPAAEASAGDITTDERAAFERHERWANLRRVGVDRDGSGGWYENPCVQSAWEGWQARAALASRPAEVDDEGLPPLPEGTPIMHIADETGSGSKAYTAEQYRQGQRDAVAADRARRAAAGGDQ